MFRTWLALLKNHVRPHLDYVHIIRTDVWVQPFAVCIETEPVRSSATSRDVYISGASGYPARIPLIFPATSLDLHAHYMYTPLARYMAYLTLQTFTTECCGEYVLGFRVHMSPHARKPNRRTSKITPHSITSIMTTALFDALLLASHVNIDVPKRTRREDSKNAAVTRAPSVVSRARSSARFLFAFSR